MSKTDPTAEMTSRVRAVLDGKASTTGNSAYLRGYVRYGPDAALALKCLRELDGLDDGRDLTAALDALTERLGAAAVAAAWPDGMPEYLRAAHDEAAGDPS